VRRERSSSVFAPLVEAVDVEAAAVTLDVDVEDVAGTVVVEGLVEAAMEAALVAGAAAGVAGVAGDEAGREGEEGLAAGGYSSGNITIKSCMALSASSAVRGLATIASSRARRPPAKKPDMGGKGGSKGRRAAHATR
jgi:hypothetical protein